MCRILNQTGIDGITLTPEFLPDTWNSSQTHLYLVREHLCCLYMAPYLLRIAKHMYCQWNFTHRFMSYEVKRSVEGYWHDNSRTTWDRLQQRQNTPNLALNWHLVVRFWLGTESVAAHIHMRVWYNKETLGGSWMGKVVPAMKLDSRSSCVRVLRTGRK